MERIEGEKKEAEDTLYVVEEDHELLLEGEEGEEDDAGLSEEDTPVAEARYVHVNNRAANAASGFPTNMTSTTKYTWWNFLFKNLYEQFRRVANSYFLLVMSIQLIPGVAPITPLTSILPLLFVLCVTAAKDAWDDWNRRKADNEVNNRTAAVCERGRGSIWKDVAYRDIVVGDLIKIHDNEEFPADIVLLKSAASDHQCFIETSNLDGETTKKIKRALAFTSAITESELAGIDAVVECDAPNIHLDSFNGKFTLKSYHADAAACAYTLTSRARRRSRGGSPDGDADLLFPLNEMHLLPRGARLVNTASIIGVVVYTGRDTKLMLNQQPVPLKFSFVERTTNKLLIALVAFVLTLCLATAALSVYWTNEVGSRVPYLMLSTNMEADLMLGVRNFLTLFVLFNTFLPISLYVTIEFVKTLQAYFLANDLDLYDERSDQPVIVKTTSLLEDLGQVEYVFSDKTGTLTENKLVLKKCSIRGMLYDASGRPPLSAKAKSWHRDVRSGDADDDAKCGDDEGDDEDSDAGSEYGHGIDCDPDDGDTFPLVEGETRLEDDLLRPEVDEFLLALALCHSAFVDVTTSASTTTTTSTNTRRVRRPQQPGGEAEKEEKEQADEGGLNEKHNGAGDDEVVRAYQASSPDDEALVLAAARYGVVLTSRVGDRLTVRLHGRDHVFQVLAELPFDSDRKRMSVIVRTPSGEVRIYCKGAETVVLPRLKHYRGADSDSGHTDKKQQQQQRQPESAEWACIAQTEQHINHYARQGLRTLLVSMATLEPSRCDEWLAIYRRAAMAVHHRKAKLAQAAELIEQELHLLGATAIEDKLQKGVPETLRDLGRAGIKVWVLTGDKQETAINIGYSAHVLDERMELITINVSSSQACQEALAIAQDRLGPPPSGKSKVAGPKCALVVDGQSLTHALADHKTAFREVAKRCQSVICCRVSAKQKAEVVGLVKDEGHVTLAIGDGANDVSMIRRAHVGIGIIGKEGSQASRSSDYAIAQFRFLKKLLLVHGRYAYLRIATLIQYYFYKNATFTLPQVYFSFFNGFSGQTLFDSWIIVLFNIVFTSMPILLVGLWDRDVPQEALLQFPRLYSRSRSNQEFNFKTFSWWLGSAVLHSALIFYFAWSIANTVLPNGHPADLFLFGVTISTSAITIVTFKLAIETSTWTVIHHVVFWGSLAVYFVFLSLYGLVPRLHHADNHIYWAFFTLFRSTSFWLTYLTLVVCSLLPDLVCKSVVLHFCPGEWRVMREYWLWMRPRQRRAAALYGVTAPSVQNRSETRPLLGSTHEEEGLG